MGQFYLDIETSGLNPATDKIITIQFQELDRYSGKAVGELIILKEWESSEKDILKEFILKSRILDPYSFSFVAVGYNLCFEHNFLKKRTEINGLPSIDILTKPFLDLRAIGILMNKGVFKGSALKDITGKKGKGAEVPEWYARHDYKNIIDYIVNETEEFIKLNVWLYQEMPHLAEKFKEYLMMN
ncbi:MAG: hypothetical protein RL557_265 [archaeon]|jgi:hypothetical protein